MKRTRTTGMDSHVDLTGGLKRLTIATAATIEEDETQHAQQEL